MPFAVMAAVAVTSTHPHDAFPHADLVVGRLTELAPQRLAAMVTA